MQASGVEPHAQQGDDAAMTQELPSQAQEAEVPDSSPVEGAHVREPHKVPTKVRS